MTKGKGRNPGAGNLDKHIKRTEHKERSQPASRKHLGQLEKHKDHILRAKKRKQKVEKLQSIKRAAAQRNPDEFNIGMTKAVMDIASGRMKRRKQSQLPKERVADLKKTIGGNTRNVQYLEFKAQADRNRARDLLEEDSAAALTASKPKNTHTVFVEDEETFKRFNPLKYFDTTKEMLHQHPAVRGKLSVLKNTVLPDEILLSGGHTMKSVSQKRKERRELTRKLQKLGDDTEVRGAFLEREKVRKELKQYRFSDLIAEDEQSRRAAAGGGGVDEDDDEDGNNNSNHVEDGGDGKSRGALSSSTAGGGVSAHDDVAALLAWRKEAERQESLSAARRMREVSQRMERSRSLTALAKTVRRQNSGIEKQIRQKANSRFKPNAARRAR